VTAICEGDRDDHCCHVDGEVCRFLEQDTVPGRRWACGLYRRLGSWPAVYADPGYVEHVQPFFDAHGARLDARGCGDCPGPGRTCATCGVTGDG
jgi:hypothetical protein